MMKMLAMMLAAASTVAGNVRKHTYARVRVCRGGGGGAGDS